MPALLAAVTLAIAAAQSARVFVTGSLMSGDAVYYFCHLHTLVVDRDLDPTNEIDHFQRIRSPYTGRAKIGNAAPIDPATGHAVDKYPVGTALLLLPAYAAVYIGSLLLGSFGIPADISGYGWTYQLAAGWLTAAYAGLGLLAMIQVSRSTGASEDNATAATLLVALGTPWLFYATLEPLFAHALSATAVAGLMWAWLVARARNRAVSWALTGIAAGVAATIRYQDGLFLLVPLIDVVLHGRRRAVALGALAVGTSIGASPQLVVNTLLWGQPFRTGYAAESFSHLASPWLLFTLFSAKVGLLRWSPIVGIAVAGLMKGAWRGSIVARLGLLAVAVQWCLVSSWYFVSQGHSFGNRMLTNCTVLFAVGLAEVLRWTGGTGWSGRSGSTGWSGGAMRRVVLLSCGLAVAVNLALIGLWALGRIGPLAR